MTWVLLVLVVAVFIDERCVAWQATRADQALRADLQQVQLLLADVMRTTGDGGLAQNQVLREQHAVLQRLTELGASVEKRVTALEAKVT